MNFQRLIFVLWFVLFFIANTLVLGFVSIVAGVRSPVFARKLAKIWAGINLCAAKIKVQVEGKENIPANVEADHSGFIIAASHSSALDIPVIFKAIPLDLCIVAKASLLKLPMVGRHIKMVQIPIERGRSGSAKQFIKTGLKRLMSGVSVVVFPEGTWNKGNEKLIPFKKGAFLLARVSGRPIIPVAIVGSRNLLPADRWLPRSGTVTLRIGKSIEPSGFSANEAALLPEKTFQALLDLLPD